LEGGAFAALGGGFTFVASAVDGLPRDAFGGGVVDAVQYRGARVCV
jgi:hypothetical protein